MQIILELDHYMICKRTCAVTARPFQPTRFSFAYMLGIVDAGEKWPLSAQSCMYTGNRNARLIDDASDISDNHVETRCKVHESA